MLQGCAIGRMAVKYQMYCYGTFDYAKQATHPDFNLSLRCNFVDGTSGTTYLKLVGSEGSMDVHVSSVT